MDEGRRSTDIANAQVASAVRGTEWITRWMIGALLLVLISLAGVTTTLAFSQITNLTGRVESLQVVQASDARDLGALKARADASDVRLAGIDQKLDRLDQKMDRVITVVQGPIGR